MKSDSPAAFLLTHFDRLAEAPSGTAKLRALLLQLGVQGKLTQQSPEDTPATENISHFRKLKQPFTPISADELPFQIPATWVWARLGACMELFNGRAFKPTDWSTQGLPIIRIKNLNNESAPFNHCATAVDARHLVKNDDFLISWSGTPGTSFGAFIWKRGKAVLNQHIFRAELSSPELYKPYTRLAVNSRLDELIEKAHGGVGLQHVTKPTLERLPLPIPPLAEQRRIVAKVEELMGLCDALEAAQREREAVRTRLRTSALHQLTTPDGDSTSVALALNHLNQITTESEDLASLRASIRQLAATGRIAASATTVFQPAGEPRDEFSIPSNWEMHNFGSIIRKAHTGLERSKAEQSPNRKYVYLKMNNMTNDGRCDLSSVVRVDASEEEVADYALSPGDFLFNTRNSAELVGKTCVFQEADGEIVLLNNNILKVGFIDDCDSRFINLWFCCPAGRAGLSRLKSSTTNVAAIYQGKLNTFLVPLPPLAEQRRIVAKVDELIAVLDALEVALTAERATSEKLLAATVARINVE